MNKNNKIKLHKNSCIIVFALTAVVSLNSCAGMALAEKFLSNRQEKFKGIEHLMMKNYDNKCVSLDTSEPIGVIIKNATEEERQDIINAIAQMNNISSGLNFILCDSKDLKLKNNIYIYAGEDIGSYFKNDCFGLTNFTYSNSDLLINFPITVSIDEDVRGMHDDQTGASAFSFILKHELMHALGFVDIYSEEYLNKTIMYYQINANLNISDFTAFDIENIQKIYGKGVHVVTPSEMTINYDYKQNDFEMFLWKKDDQQYTNNEFEK